MVSPLKCLGFSRDGLMILLAVVGGKPKLGHCCGTGAEPQDDDRFRVSEDSAGSDAARLFSRLQSTQNPSGEGRSSRFHALPSCAVIITK